MGYERRSPEHRETRNVETSPNTVQSFDRWITFINSHQDSIEQKANQGAPLADIFYDDFYAAVAPSHAYTEGTKEYKKIKAEYENMAAMILEKYLELAKKYATAELPVIDPSPDSINNGWIYFKITGGADQSDKNLLGRLYLNINPNDALRLYDEILPMLYHKKIAADIKISKDATIDELNRPDRITLYFNDVDEKKLLQLIEELYQKNTAAFSAGSPPFTAPLTTSDGFVMEGVSFGQEPEQLLNKKQSFGSLRCTILAELYKELTTRPDGMRYEEAYKLFQTLCEKYHVDPTNAAFNTLSNDSLAPFPLMRKRENHILRPQDKRVA